MSDEVVEVAAGDTNEEQPENSAEALNVDTQPSMLKKGGLFGNSVAMSPKVGDRTPSPVDKSSANGNEVSSSNTNGKADANANGDHKDEGDIDLTADDDEVMVLEEPEEEEEEEEEEPEPAPAPAEEPAAAADEPDEPEEAAEAPAVPAAVAEPVVERAVEVFEDIEMEDEAEEEEEIEEVDAIAPQNGDNSDDVVMLDDSEDAPAAEEEEEEAPEAVEEKEEPKTAEEPAEEPKEEEEEEEAPKEDEAVEPEETEVEAEEECVKKVISMDTDETAEEPAEAKEDEEEETAEEEKEETAKEEEEETAKADESSAALDASTQEAKADEEEEDVPAVVVTPKRGRGRPPKSASSTPAAKKTPSPKKAVSAAAAVNLEADTETAAAAAEETSSPSSKRTPRGAAKKAAEAIASPPPSAKGRGRRSIKSDTSSTEEKNEEAKEEEEEKETAEETAKKEEEEEVKTPAARGRRSVKATPATATRGGSTRGKKAVEEEEKEKEEEEVKEEEDKKDEEQEEEEEVAEKTPRRGRGRPAGAASVKKEASTKSAKKAEAFDADDEEEKSVASSRRSTRGSGSPTKTPVAATPKGRGRKSSLKSDATMEEEEEEKEDEEEEVEEKKGRGRGRKSTAKTPTAASAKKGKKAGEADDAEDPFDLDTELDKHPEPLRNITVEKGSFGAVAYTRSPAASKSKYAATERSASDKVANLPNTPAATGTPGKTIASVQSTRKSLGGSPTKRTPATRKSKKGGDSDEEGEEEMDEDEAMEDAAMETPTEKRGRPGRPSGAAGRSTGRKRKAASPAATSTSAKRQAVAVTIPALDEEKQWAADHPEDDSAPFVPGARVFAVFQKVFYPALVGERDGLGRYLVEFVEDGIVRPVPPAGVVPLSAVTIDKECLYAPSSDVDPVYCRVLRSANAANAREWQQGTFKLMQINNEEIEYDANWTSLQLDMAKGEWKQYVNAKSKMVTKINTDNITSLEDRRERRSRVHNDTAVALATLSGTPEPTTRRSVTRKTPATAKTAKVSPKMPSTGRRGRPAKTPKTPAAAAEEKEDEKEEQEEEEEGDEKMETDEPAVEPRPQPLKEITDERIFLNKTFILTSANRTTSDVVFKKNEMKKQILERGGIVLEDINQVPLDADAYLISDTHYRTHKYLAAMSRGMPCLSHKWLIECVKKEQLVATDEYKLAGGQGLLNGELYPLPDVRAKLLVGRTIMVHSKTDSSMKRGTMGFKQIWSPIVELLGASVMADTCLTDAAAAGGDAIKKLVVPADFEILLTDSSCPPEVVQKLEAAGKSVVSSEWLIQSIIMGKCPAYDAHPRFRYDSGNEPAGGATSKKEGSQEQSQS